MPQRETLEAPPVAPPVAFAKLAELEAALESAIRGKPEVVRLSLVCLLARGHLLIEDVPGVGKTTLAHALAHAVDGRFHRLQFTSDMLPSDVLGVTIYNAHAGAFDTQLYRAAQELIANVNKGLNPGQLATDIHATLVATQRGMEALTKATNGPAIQQTQATLASLERVMSHLDTLLGAANPAQTGKRLDTLSTNLTQLTTRLADATGSLKGLLDKMDKGEGTLGKIATDTMLYKNLNATLKSLSELLTDLKERPGRYLTVKVF